MVPRLYLTLLTVAGTAAAQSTVEIENQRVRVLRVKLAPHEKTPEQDHPDSVAVYLTDLGNHKAGEVAWLAAAKHTEENPSDQPAEFVLPPHCDPAAAGSKAPAPSYPAAHPAGRNRWSGQGGEA